MQTDEKGKKSKERLEEEKRAILKQRVRPLDIDGADAARLADKAKELLTLITRLEGEKYDLEKNYKTRQMEVSRCKIADYLLSCRPHYATCPSVCPCVCPVRTANLKTKGADKPKLVEIDQVKN